MEVGVLLVVSLPRVLDGVYKLEPVCFSCPSPLLTRGFRPAYLNIIFQPCVTHWAVRPFIFLTLRWPSPLLEFTGRNENLIDICLP